MTPARSDRGADAGHGIHGPEDPSPAGAASGAMLVAYRLATLALAAIGALVCWQGRQLVYYTPYGPGPAFFPLWLGGLLIVLALFLLIVSFVARPSLTGALVPPSGARLDLAVTLGAILFFALMIERLGFALTVFPMLATVLLVRRCGPVPAIIVAAVASFGVGYVFSNHLGVALPRAPGDLLLAIGL